MKYIKTKEIENFGLDLPPLYPYGPVKLFRPHPPRGTPWDITFLGEALVFLSLYFYLALP